MSAPETIRIDNVEYVRKDYIPAQSPVDGIPFTPGNSYFIRTVTYHLTGRVHQIIGGFLILKNAAWIADSGRFMNAIKEGKLNEVEPVGDAIVAIYAITDAFPWPHQLPEQQK